MLGRALPVFVAHDDVMWHDHTPPTLGYAQLGLRNSAIAADILSTTATTLSRSGDRRGHGMALRADACAERQRSDFHAALQHLEHAGQRLH